MQFFARLLAISGCAAHMAFAHGEGTPPDLRQVQLCVDSSSVRVEFEGMTTGLQRSAQPRLERQLRSAFIRELQRAGVTRIAAVSCAGRDARVQLLANVRYLNPKQYQGFGDPAYSYSVHLTVARKQTPGGKSTPRFTAMTSDIHSEAQTRRKFEIVVAEWGAELAGDLSEAWQKANPKPKAPSATPNKP